MFHYSSSDHTAYCVALIDHADEKHIWVSFITGEWPNTGNPDCYVTYHVWSNSDGIIMEIKDSAESPFEKGEVFDSYPVTRDQVLAVDGAKEWVINTYLQLFENDSEVGTFIENSD